jgi:hypothetical protein
MSNSLPFTEADSDRAYKAWRFNCGPGAVCGLLGLTPDQLRPHCGSFEQKGHTNPTLMFEILRNLGKKQETVYRGDVHRPRVPFPRHALMRVQWDGPWTQEGVPMGARYKETHWVALRRFQGERQVFDINAMNVGGWIPYLTWKDDLVPYLIKEGVPRANGQWWPTHIIEVSQKP